MAYSIGQVSKLLGLSVEGIRNYEKSGIIASRRDEGSNYRKYSYLDIAALIRAKMYRSFGYSIRDTQVLTNDLQVDEITGALRRKEEEIAREILIMQEKLQYIRNLRQLTEQIEEKVGRVEITRMPAVYRMEFSHNGQIDFSPGKVAMFQQWMEYVPFVYMSSRYRGEDVYGGLAIHKDHARLFGIGDTPEKKEGITFHDSSLCLMLTVMEGDTGYSRTSTLKELKEYADRHNFILDEDMIGHIVIGIRKSTDYQRYRQVFARIMNI